MTPLHRESIPWLPRPSRDRWARRRHTRAHLARAAAVLLLALPALSATRIHDRLVHSFPAAGDTLHAVPRELRLAFSREFPRDTTVPGAAVTLSGPDGAIALGDPAVSADTASVLVATISGVRVAGDYTVTWQILGADGHPVRGTFTFRIADHADGLPVEPAPVTTAADPETTTVLRDEDVFDASSPLYAVIRWVWFLNLTALIGAAVFLSIILQRAAPRGADAGVTQLATRRAASAGAVAAAFCLLAGAARLWAQSRALGGTNAFPLQPLITGTTWGTGWLIQMGGGAIAVAGFTAAFAGRRAGMHLAAVGALLSAFAPPLSGHAMTAPLSPLPIIADGIHVLAAGGWLGALLVLVLIGLPAAQRAGDGAVRQAALLVNTFSPVALSFAGLLLLTGALTTVLHAGSLAALLASTWGRTLGLKLLVVAAAVAFGAWNWRRGRHALGDTGGVQRIRRSARAELASGALVLLITAVLVATPPPAEDAHDDAVARSAPSAR